MRNILVVFFIFLSCLFCYSGYYYVVFCNDANLINHILNDADTMQEIPPDNFRKIVIIFDGESGIIRFVSSKILFYLGYCNEKNVFWQIKRSIMMLFLFVNFSNDQMFALWCHFVPAGNELGVNKLAHSIFQKKLNQLSVKEMAELAVFSRSPNLETLDSAKFNKIVNDLLLEFNKHL